MKFIEQSLSLEIWICDFWWVKHKIWGVKYFVRIMCPTRIEISNYSLSFKINSVMPLLHELFLSCVSEISKILPWIIFFQEKVNHLRPDQAVSDSSKPRMAFEAWSFSPALYGMASCLVRWSFFFREIYSNWLRRHFIKIFIWPNWHSWRKWIRET